MEQPPPKTYLAKQRLLRCADWLQKQNSQEPKKLALQNKNDIQFIIQTNADRKNFLLSAAEDLTAVPAGVGEPALEPAPVPHRKLRTDGLKMECEWQSCRWQFTIYDLFQKHVKDHSSDLHVLKEDEKAEYVCLWDVCGYKTPDFEAMIRHINFHAYHAYLLAVGLNGRATLRLERCKRDSKKRNMLPAQIADYICMWINCMELFNSYQAFLDHVKLHVKYSDNFQCSWAGCGAQFSRRVLFSTHMRKHTGEKVIACYHCGRHFATNQKLIYHLKRQNVNPNSTHRCTVCGSLHANNYLLREHERQHISAHACPLCDMSAPTPATLAQHMRYRHLPKEETKIHACPDCPYKAVAKADLRRHIEAHERKKKKEKKELGSDKDMSDEENSEEEKKKKEPPRKYACHMCPKKKMMVFSRGNSLTVHLLKVHGFQWPFGHSRFRYQISEDGYYRLTTTRYEFLDVSRKIVDGYSWPKESLNNTFEFNLQLKSEATEITPKSFVISVKTENDSDNNDDNNSIKNDINKTVEITMCDVDEDGNVINSKIINSEVIT